MCRVKNLTTTAQDFDSWFAKLNYEDQIPEFDVTLNVQDLLAPLPMFEPMYTPETIEPVVFQSNVYPSPPPSLSCTVNVEAELEDTQARKRKRQNEAAKRCRQKKASLIEQSKDMAKKYEQEKFEMSLRLAVLEKEKNAWLSKERDMQAQLNRLKEQLDESHLILMKMKPGMGMMV